MLEYIFSFTDMQLPEYELDMMENWNMFSDYL